MDALGIGGRDLPPYSDGVHALFAAMSAIPAFSAFYLRQRPVALQTLLKMDRILAVAEQLRVHDNRSVDRCSSDRNNVDPGNTFGRSDSRPGIVVPSALNQILLSAYQSIWHGKKPPRTLPAFARIHEKPDSPEDNLRAGRFLEQTA